MNAKYILTALGKCVRDEFNNNYNSTYEKLLDYALFHFKRGFTHGAFCHVIFEIMSLKKNIVVKPK